MEGGIPVASREDQEKAGQRRLGVPFELREYEVDPDDLAAETVARTVGLPSDQ